MKPRTTTLRCVLCVKNRGVRAALEIRKAYRVVEDAAAARLFAAVSS